MTVAPQDVDAEEAVLSAMLLAPAAIDSALAELEPQHFFRSSHGQLFATIRALHLAGTPVDPLTVANALEAAGTLSEVGGRAHVNEVASRVTAAAHVAHHARIVREQAARRELQRALMVAQQQIEQGASAETVQADLDRALLERSLRERGDSAVVSSNELAAWHEAQTKDPPDVEAGLPGPWRFLPRLLPSRMYVIAGYTAHGKTAVACQFVEAACEAGGRVGYVSLEMGREDLTDRLVSAFGPVPYPQVQEKRIRPAHMEAYRGALRRLARWHLDVIDDSEANAAAVLRYQRIRRYDLLVVDHLHRIPLAADRYRLALEAEVRALTNVARLERVPILLLAQLSRPHGTDGFPRPSLSSLRDSAVIEQEAWQVSFVWRKAGEDDLPGEEAELITAKNRSGPCGVDTLRFDAPQVRYVLP